MSVGWCVRRRPSTARATARTTSRWVGGSRAAGIADALIMAEQLIGQLTG